MKRTLYAGLLSCFAVTQVVCMDGTVGTVGRHLRSAYIKAPVVTAVCSGVVGIGAGALIGQPAQGCLLGALHPIIFHIGMYQRADIREDITGEMRRIHQDPVMLALGLDLTDAEIEEDIEKSLKRSIYKSTGVACAVLAGYCMAKW